MYSLPPKRKADMEWVLLGLCFWSLLLLVSSQCPWSRELVDLHTDCVCAYSNSQRLSIQCSPVNFTKLVQTLKSSVKNIPIDLLYISNSTIEILQNGIFDDLKIQSLHLSKSKIRDVEVEAFRGLEESLSSLNLQDNLIREVPTEAMGNLTSLQFLDLSHNLIRDVPNDAFKGLPLTTLKLSDNRLNISDFAFRGLEGTVKNLNLQACELTAMPKAIQRLKVLAFLDLAQNKIEALEPEFLSEMQSLTAINLERNKIKDVDEKAFMGVNATLSTVSLLNNMLSEYPMKAIEMLSEIRVLDLGFNGITILPHDAFKRNKYLTLLALDGNPLPTIPVQAFLHLNSTLRGLSLGGSALQCDCRIRWIAEWVQARDLQVTSRERNPQFCGSPEHLRKRNFFQLLPSDMICDNETQRHPTKRPKRLNVGFEDGSNNVKDTADNIVQIVTLDTHVDITGTTKADTKADTTPIEDLPVRSGTSSVRKKENKSIRIKHAYKRDSTLVLEWESTTEPILGYQVLIRMFGSRDLKRIVPVPSERRQLQLEHLPLSQCLVVCVIDYEEPSTIKVDSIPSRQCRELKGDDSRILSLDKIVIAASAVICVVVIIGALVIILFYFRRRDILATPSSSMHRHSDAPAVLPALVKQPPPETDWETLSWNSGRSTPKTNVHNCLMSKSGSTSHSFVLNDGQLQDSHKGSRVIPNGFSKSYSTHDNESRLSYSHISAKISQNNLDIQRSKSLTRPHGYQPYSGGHTKRKKHRQNGRLASASSSTECESDWNSRSIWKDNDVDIYISQNHMVPGSRKYRKDYSIR
ncbi:leucine-rich repeat-containing G-protein coupled receptor 4-like [Stegodyphus dumicola]|uniref:leucine-rich repeat-containing G-protein coupled receptor 4-like n=1 Tax=Stegodyphus dumicola TaxID=202533 RepID=UPI0015ADE46C|nr:leucine-rich repeat-containing G-protein coupled receptor 4-like [Stegodyphus dumicola]